jgi:hypothetical protein
MHSRIAGAFIFLLGRGVRLVFLNLSKLRPVRDPQAYTAWRVSRVGMFTVNAPDCSISGWEWRVGAMLRAMSGGFVEVGIAQARVIMLGLFVLLVHETNTVCIGWSSLVDDERFIGVFADM